MGRYCPGCGSEIKEGSKFCQSCGTQIQSDTKINTFEDQVAQPQTQQTPSAQFPQQTSAPAQQQIGQTQAYAPMTPKKAYNKIIASVVVIIVVIVFISIIYFLFLSGGSDSRFVGDWEQVGAYPAIWTFNNDGSFESMGFEVATWRINGNQICIKPNEMWEGFTTEMCYDFEFSNNGNTLTLSSNGFEFAKLTKK